MINSEDCRNQQSSLKRRKGEKIAMKATVKGSAVKVEEEGNKEKKKHKNKALIPRGKREKCFFI